MIEFYYWPTPNGHKITMFLEEAGLDYTIHPVDISAGDQFKPEFLAFSPNNRMPAIIDTAPADGGEAVTVFESGAILVYVAEKTGSDRWPGRTTISASTRRKKSPTRSTVTSARRTGFTASSTAGWRVAPTSSARTTRSPIWPP